MTSPAQLQNPNPPAAERTLRHLEWSRVSSAWLSRCRGPGARRLGVQFAGSFGEAQQLLQQTAEAARSLADGEGLPLDDLRDLGPHLERLERDGTLDSQALADVRVTLQNAARVRRFLGARRAQLPALFATAALDPSLDQLEEQLASAIELDGTLRDGASAELAELRSEIASLRARIVGRLEDVIARHGDLLSDNYFTQRDGRYVLPVRRDAHDRLPGIVHGTSGSGASIFVEPRAVVVHGNRLKVAEAEREREELRILAALSERVRDRLAELNAAEDSLSRLDLRHAAALLARDYAGTVPELLDRPLVALLSARHPGLVLDGVSVVANDLALEAGRGLVVSGPNAGGKTVVLKTLGLCALMVRAGLLLPAAEGSRIGFFDPILTEMGDEQSTATNLSTFSAHVRNLVAILAQTRAGAMVLLDELATGTDPGEGAALACALTQAFCERGAALAVTTHYEALKALSERDGRLRSASVGFDPQLLAPTFNLLLDVPGASSALSVARRYGMPSEVIESAERFVPEQARDFERLVRRLTEAVTRANTEREALGSERRQLELECREQERRTRELAEQSRRKLSREAEQLMGELRGARSELEQARDALRKHDRGARELAEAERKIKQAAARVAVDSELANVLARDQAGAATHAPPEIAAGLKVYVPRLRSEAVIVEGPQKNKVLIAVGAMKLWVELGDLRKPTEAASEATSPSSARAPVEADALRTSDNTLDVRGLRADDALAMLDSFIDRLYAGPQRVGYVLHGHGTGALRSVVREHLRTPPYVQTIRPGEPDEGGDAITVFYLQ